jgi:hypothetical protein
MALACPITPAASSIATPLGVPLHRLFGARFPAAGKFSAAHCLASSRQNATDAIALALFRRRVWRAADRK